MKSPDKKKSIHNEKSILASYGMSKTRFHDIWRNMKTRCRNKKDHNYKTQYGSKGIDYCDSWESFANFYEDMYAKYIQHVKEFGEKNTELDRIDNLKGYLPGNCRWATSKEQARNTKRNRLITYYGETKCISAWAEEYGLKVTTLYMRIMAYKWPIEKALTTPVI